ncbi:hypothetical protein DVK85_11035 [Flavobacterium arcticum]|uniref:YtxH domain-containing protein n=1 Tax=Flavobacterium arcticum TaxID=1784713 RepID=A0A345HDS5_9FLAO|nr:hypothetical protein [Flavobacterium arcticum]AXG74735.1 hypothetical protein DVK85_11035 [Flavobacterium arcticum]KAF2509765.1 hypothetical protein E0W72_09640 [Flavobacterium arcticum]
MSNKKVVVGVAAGVAALAVVGLLLKRKGHLDGLSEKVDDLSHDLKDRFKNVKESAKRKFDEVVKKGEDIAEKNQKTIDA